MIKQAEKTENGCEICLWSEWLDDGMSCEDLYCEKRWEFTEERNTCDEWEG